MMSDRFKLSGAHQVGRAEDLFAVLEQRGRAYVDELIATRKSEEAFLDFKRSADDGAGPRLHENDRDNLSKCLSGFGNSEGGLVLWGVASGGAGGADTANAIKLLADAPRFAAQVDATISALTVPSVIGVRSIPILDGAGPAGFVATLVPQSHHAPHQTTKDRVFYIRSGSSFQRAMVSILAGLFGRAPRPNVTPSIQPGEISYGISEGYSILNASFSVVLQNNSGVLAPDFYASLTATGFDNDKIHFFCHPLSQAHTNELTTGDYDSSLVSNADVRLAPRAKVSMMTVEIHLWTNTGRAPRDVSMTLTAGTSGAPPVELEMRLAPTVIKQAFDEWAALWRDPETRRRIAWEERILQLLGLPSGL